MEANKNARPLIRLGLAFTFIYSAISAFASPEDWVGFVPVFVESLISREIFLVIFSSFEILLGIWLISGKFQFWAGVISSVVLLGIILGSFGVFSVTFRDVGLFFSAVALILLYRK